MACNPSVTSNPVAVLDCADWTSGTFFRQASPDDVAHCLSEGADPNAQNEYGDAPLLEVLHAYDEVPKNIPEVVKLLLDAGADPNLLKKEGWTSLHMAVLSGKPLAAVKALLDAGADPNAHSFPGRGWVGRGLVVDGPTSLHVAAGSGNPAVVKALLDAGADPNAEFGQASSLGLGLGFGTVGLTPLHVAAGGGNPAVVKTLLDADADLNAQSWFFGDGSSSSTPLHVAAGSGNTAVVKALLDAGADPNTGVHETPLQAAVDRGNLAVVKALLDAGADPNAQSYYWSGWSVSWVPSTHLHAAVSRGKVNPAVVKALLDAGADPNARDEAGNTPFDLIPDDSPLIGTDVYQQLRGQ